MVNISDADYQICKLLIEYTDLESRMQAATQTYARSGNMGDVLRALQTDASQIKQEVERIYAETYGIVQPFGNLQAQYAGVVNYVRNGEVERKAKL